MTLGKDAGVQMQYSHCCKYVEYNEQYIVFIDQKKAFNQVEIHNAQY